MKVVDWDRSERGRQRRRSPTGRPLHCCCVCGKVAPWDECWSYFGSYKQIDDGEPVAKFCSTACQSKAGPKCRNITDDMKRRAEESEMREPELAWREATQKEKYAAAVDRQRRTKKTESGALS